MKITNIGELKTVMSNPHSRHKYFGWPSVVKLQNGKILVGASGFRLGHICPFGKAVIAVSDDNGESYSPIASVIDTPLDDRDVGLMTFGESGVILTSFTNEPAFQNSLDSSKNDYKSAYLATVTDEEISKYVGSDFIISKDCGKTFSDIYRSPVSSPHGPTKLSDGTILWVGTYFENENSRNVWGVPEAPCGIERTVFCYSVDPENGQMEYVGRIDSPENDLCYDNCHEPHMVEAPDGTLICHIRAHGGPGLQVYQSESHDKGKSWSIPHYLADGSPAHLLVHSSGALISTYGYREEPFGIRVMISFDNGKSWDKDHQIYVNPYSPDLGYPATCELEDGSLLTVFYATYEKDSPSIILQQKWRFEK